MTLHDQTLTARDEMATERREELLSVLAPDRLRSHVVALHAEVAAIALAETTPMIGPGSVDWIGLGRQAHAAAGHAQVLGFRRIGALLNALEDATGRRDGAGTEAARVGLARQLALGAPSPGSDADAEPEPGRSAAAKG